MKTERLRLAIFAGMCLGACAVQAQVCTGLPEVPDATITPAQDRDRMMCQLGLTYPMLPPRIEDPNAPVNAWPVNAANPEGNWTDPLGHTVVRTNWGLWHTYDDDAGAAGGAMSGFGDYGPYSSPRYPDIDPLRLKRGWRIDSPEEWWTKRRPELFKLTQQQLYGKPIDPTIPVSWVSSAETSGVQVVGADSYAYRERRLTGTVDISSYPQLRNTPVITALCRYPAESGRKYPVIVTYGENVARFQFTAQYDIAVCSYTPGGVQPDSGGANLSSYLIGLANKGQWRKPDDPGSLVAWGWGVSRLIDRFAVEPDFDADKVAVMGHSRYGKATLVTAAYDPRVVVAWPSDAGALGTAPARRHYGESLEFVASASGEYHWVNGNIMKFGGELKPGKYIPRRVQLLDVDAHTTTALLAPRAIFVTNGTDTPPGFGDAWADPRGTFLSGKMASPVWELLGWKGQIIPEGTVFTSGPGESIGGTPPFNVAFIAGTVGWRRQIEGHVSTPNWPTFAEFAARYLNDGRPSITAGQHFVLGEGGINKVGVVTAEDADADDAISGWQIKGGTGLEAFDIDADSGLIEIANPWRIDFARAEKYTLTLMTGDGKLPSHDAEVAIHIPRKVHMCSIEIKKRRHGGKHDYEVVKRTILVSKHAVRGHLLAGHLIGGCDD